MSGRFEYIRKNRNIYDGMKHCNAESQGVDLNRNYGYKFAHDNQGSSGRECAEDYRGPSAFSEPETAAMRDFLIGHPKIQVALNFHAWGPLFIMPYNSDSSPANSGVSKKAQKFYDEVFDHTGVPKGYILGNGAKTIGYTANGEASDWMLHELGIYAASPELGIDMREAEDFFIRSKGALIALVRQNFDWIEHTMLLLFEKIDCQQVKSAVTRTKLDS